MDSQALQLLCAATLLACCCCCGSTRTTSHFLPKLHVQRTYFPLNENTGPKRPNAPELASVASNLTSNYETNCATPTDFESYCIAIHNRWRIKHHAPYLIYDEKVSKYAKWRAKTIADSDGKEFGHLPGGQGYGENLAWHGSKAVDCLPLVNMWYDEEKEYDYDKGLFTKGTGHFTQVVWIGTRSVGCGEAIGVGKRGGIYLVCNYLPPGNYQNRFKENVNRP